MKHPVIQHLLVRKNKKVPIKDGRKIVLVSYGGVMASIRGAGAMIALSELGLDNAFDEVYAYSGGFCNASYLLSGNGREGTSIYYEELSGHNFINLRKVLRVADIDYVIKCIKSIKPLNVKNVLAHPTKIFVQVDDLTKKKIEFLEVHEHAASRYFTLLKAAIKIPYLSPGGVRIGSAEFKDTFEDAIFRKALDSDATDIVVCYNMLEQHKDVHKKFDKEIFKSGRILEFKPHLSWNLSRFETNPKVLKKACIEMGTMVKNLFGSKKKISLKYTPTSVINSTSKKS
jgi:predicted patatin/cPLA2 family phospholipase